MKLRLLTYITPLRVLLIAALLLAILVNVIDISRYQAGKMVAGALIVALASTVLDYVLTRLLRRKPNLIVQSFLILIFLGLLFLPR